jgi:hypothetical protein
MHRANEPLNRGEFDAQLVGSKRRTSVKYASRLQQIHQPHRLSSSNPSPPPCNDRSSTFACSSSTLLPPSSAIHASGMASSPPPRSQSGDCNVPELPDDVLLHIISRTAIDTFLRFRQLSGHVHSLINTHVQGLTQAVAEATCPKQTRILSLHPRPDSGDVKANLSWFRTAEVPSTRRNLGGESRFPPHLRRGASRGQRQGRNSGGLGSYPSPRQNLSRSRQSSRI